jgi:hypothetical protein
VAPAPVVTPPPPPAPVASPPPAPIVQTAPPRDEAPRNAGVRRAGIGLLVLGGALAVVGGIFEATSWNKYNSSKNGACLSTTGGCTKAADAIDQRALLSKIFFAGAAATGLTGGTLIVLYPVSEPENPTAVSGLGARAAFSF